MAEYDDADRCSALVTHMEDARVMRPWLELKMLDLNEMIITQLKKQDASFPNVTKGILVAMALFLLAKLVDVFLK
ncbi:unnamed protein product [Sphenostylis stenocarpa]|uniref:Uncharacterized protein n=1 Tax=Sphenostylis stenocarpa TaxID=92480 RepID=A0AA86SQA7_9FABA|nr:unnamed protein product [Sphenostylis stenocarpa]